VRSNSAGDVVIVPGVALQRRGWPHRADSNGDDRSRQPDVTAQSCVDTGKAFEGSAAPPPSKARHVSRTEVGGTVSRGDTGLTTQCYTVAGMAFPRESVEQHRSVIPRRVRVVAQSCSVRALNARTREQERGRCAREGLRASRTPPEGAFSLRARRTPPEGAFRPRARGASPEGAFNLLTDKRHIPLRSASVRTPHFFHHGIPKVLVNPRSKGITSVRSTFTL
jgi:hypothetical protein